MPADTDAARLQVVLRATDPQQASTQTSFSLIVSPVFEVPEEFVTLEESLWPAPVAKSQDIFWNALLPMEALFPANATTETSTVDLTSSQSSQSSHSTTITMADLAASFELAAADPTTSALEVAAAAAVAAVTAPQRSVADLYQDFIQGTTGDDSYDLRPGDGWQTLFDPAGDDLIRIALDETEPEAGLQFEALGNDLGVSFTGTNDGLRIGGWYERNEAGAAMHPIERFQLADGRTLMAAEVDKLIAAQSLTGTTSVSQFWR